MRLDTQNLSPKEREEVKERTTQYHRAFLSLYGQFIPGHLPDQFIAERLLITDEDGYGQFVDRWAILRASYTPPESRGLMQTFLAAGRFTIGFHSEESWEWLDESERTSLITRQESEHQAKQKMMELEWQTAYIHEIAHHYQNRQMPYWFFECGGFYYARRVMEEVFKNRVSTNYDAAVSFYHSLVDKYGDDIHRFAFGQIQDKSWRDKLSSEFTDVVKREVFPFYQQKAEHTALAVELHKKAF